MYPEWTTIEEWLLGKIQVVLDYVQDPTTWVFSITERIGVFILQQLLLPLQEFLVEAPWFTTVAGLTAIAFVVSGLRPAVTTLAMLGLIGFWVFGHCRWTRSRRCSWPPRLPLSSGSRSACWRRKQPRLESDEARQRRAQTLPQLVYIIPFIYLMPVSIVPGIVAGVLYAFPVTMRLVERGVRDVAPASVEAARPSARRGCRRCRRSRSLGGRRRDARRQPGDDHGARGGGHRWARRVRRPRLRGRARARPRGVRSGRDRVCRDPRPGNRPRPGHPGNAALGKG